MVRDPSLGGVEMNVVDVGMLDPARFVDRDPGAMLIAPGAEIPRGYPVRASLSLRCGVVDGRADWNSSLDLFWRKNGVLVAAKTKLDLHLFLCRLVGAAVLKLEDGDE